MAFDPATGKFKPDDTAGVDAGVAPSVALGTGPAAVDAAPPSPGAADAGAPPDAAPAPAAPAPSDSPSFLDSALGVVKTTVNLAANPLLAPAIPAAKAVWSLLPDGTPAKPETPPAPVAPPTASAATEALTPPAPELPPPPEVHTTSHSPTVTQKLVTKEELQADRDVAAANVKSEKAIELENDARLKQASIDASQMDIDNVKKRAEADRAHQELEEAQRKKNEIDAQAKADTEAYRQAASAPGGAPGFWGSQDPVKKQSWALSLMFGAAAEVFGAEENPGRKLLDKSMSDWTAERDKNLARLEKQANQSTGLQRTFWREYGDEIKAKKELQDAAAYLSVADKIDALNEQKKGQISAKAAADNAKASAEYRQKAAEKHQAVVDDRFKDNKVVSGGTTTETISNKPAAGGANGEGEATA
jgi:hypothetical protein